MNKAERNEAADLIRTTHQTGERFELTLPCGMTVKCDNNIEARDRMAAKFEKGTKLPPNAGNLLKRRWWK